MQVQPQQVSPGENFNVFFFLRNHTDASTYYVQAKIYAIDTQELLGTHNLTQSPINSRLFIKTLTAPGDQAGYGRDIVSIATVYTDSGYTVKSESYEEQEQYFLVKPLPFFGGGGIDYRALRDIVREELEEAVKTLPKPEKLSVPDAPDMSFVDALFKRLDGIKALVSKEAPTVDLHPLEQRVTALAEQIKSRPQFERTDLTSLAEAAQNILNDLKAARSDAKVGNAALLQSIESSLTTFQEEITTAIEAKVEETIQGQELTIPLSLNVKNPKQKTEGAAPDLSHLMNR